MQLKINNMRTKIILISIILFSFSCKSQSTYSETILEQQSKDILNQEKANYSSKTVKQPLLVKDIISNLKVKPIQYSASPDSNEFEKPHYVKYIILQFFTDKEFRQKMDNQIKLFNIYIYLKKPLHESETLPLLRKTRGFWNDEVADFFGDMEVTDIRVYDLEK